MARFQTESLPQEKFLLVAVNLLRKTFVDASRTEAKKVYQQISAGDIVHLTTVVLEDESTARFNVSLAHSEFQGKLNYSAFRSSLVTLIANISQALREERELRVFNAQNEGSAMIFGVTAVTKEGESANVMVLAADMGQQAGATTLQLMYLDPTQFSSQQTPT
ncbi:MAG: hypothetical protein OSA45_13875 [Halioglobus sp.]|nr:hypothetical protein [Halioglobus sp.]